MNAKWYWWAGSAALVLGLVFAQIFHGGLQARANPSLKNQTLVETIKQLETEISAMEEELSSLRAETDRLQSEAGGEKISRSMQEDFEAQQIAAGLTELKGQGIIITLDDNSKGANAAKLNDPDNYRPNDFIVHDKNLLYLVNELKLAKARGIAINNQRLVPGSDIRCVGTVIMINSTRVAPPFEIAAVGNPKRLAEAIENGREYRYLKEKGFPIKIEASDNVTLPAFAGGFYLKHVTPAAPD